MLKNMPASLKLDAALGNRRAIKMNCLGKHASSERETGGQSR